LASKSRSRYYACGDSFGIPSSQTGIFGESANTKVERAVLNKFQTLFALLS